MKNCQECIHVKTCFLFRMAVNGKASFDEQADGIMKFPMEPSLLAATCPEYVNVLDMGKQKTEKIGV